MNQLLRQVIADILAEKKRHVFDPLLDLNGRLLVVGHDIWMVLDRVYSTMYVRKLSLERIKLVDLFFIAGFYLEKLLYD